MNLDTVTAFATAPGTGAAMGPVSGDALTIRNGAPNTEPLALAIWTKAQAVGTTQLVWPSGHDMVRGFRYRTLANTPNSTLASGVPARFRAQDPVTITQVGSAVAGDIEYCSLLMFYPDLPGVDAHMINLATLTKRMRNIVTIEDTTTATATGYSGARALNAASDLLKANTEYAVLGAEIGAVCQALTIRGVDFGGLRASIPGNTDSRWSANWFVYLSETFGIPCIPVLNSANRAGTFIENVQDENNTAVPFSLVLAELAP